MIESVLQRQAECVEEAVVLRVLPADGAQTGVSAQEATLGKLLSERDRRLPAQIERIGIDLIELPLLRRLKLEHVQEPELIGERAVAQRAEPRDQRRQRGREL